MAWWIAGTQEEAAEAYDIAAIKFRGLNAVTNFDITRYHVDKIMESNTLLPGELARRNKVDPNATAPLSVPDDSVTASALVPVSAQGTVDTGGRGHHDVLSSGEAFSALHDLVTVDGHAGQNGNGNVHMSMSAASSLVTSLSNSREESPDRGGGLSMLFAKPPQQQQATAAAPSPKLMSTLAPLGSWASSARPAAVSIAHMPMFAAWGDA
jgi:AP2-like factor (ANT lineage)